MTSTRRRKISAIPNARMPEEFYLEVYRLQLTGHSIAQTAKALDAQIPTVRRAFVKGQEALIRGATQGHRVLFDTLRLYCPEQYEAYYYVAAGMNHAMTGLYSFGMKDFYKCFTICPTRQKVRKYASERLEIFVYNGEKYDFRIPKPYDDEFTFEQIAKTDACNFCKLGAQKGNIYQPMVALPHIYYDIQYSLSLYRTPPEDEDAIARAFDRAIEYSIVNAILLNILRKADLEGEDEKSAVARMERYFLGFTQALWDCAK